MISTSAIPGYTFGSGAVPHSPVSLQEFELLKKTLLFTQEDIAQLKKSKDVLRDQVEAILDVWYGFVASHPHLVQYFKRSSDGQPDGLYLAAVRKRFGQWILDTAEGQYDQQWLDYQHEIGRRHHRSAKNAADGVSTAIHVNYRYMPAMLYPITSTLKPFLATKGHGAEEVEAMHQAWVKSVLLQIILWSYPYVKGGDF
jgi:hypothetical protein